jgi:uncharacterized protein YdeI (YjbR/CyaY-like superfamily)
MATQKLKRNDEVTKFLDALDHPLKDEIEQIRKVILTSKTGLNENIKWNGPNYCFENSPTQTNPTYIPSWSKGSRTTNKQTSK